MHTSEFISLCSLGVHANPVSQFMMKAWMIYLWLLFGHVRLLLVLSSKKFHFSLFSLKDDSHFVHRKLMVFLKMCVLPVPGKGWMLTRQQLSTFQTRSITSWFDQVLCCLSQALFTKFELGLTWLGLVDLPDQP